MWKGVLLANEYKNEDPTGYWLSEKYDGMRAIWNGDKMVTRTNNKINAPKSLLSILPQDIQLDGELFMGRQNFEKTGIFRTTKLNWENVDYIYMVFDIINDDVFENRMKLLQNIIKKINNPKIQFVPQTLVKDKKHFEEMYNNLIKLGAEGIMLRKPGTKYEFKRSNTLLKHKPLHDAEAKIVSYFPGKGKYTGLLGSFIVSGINGTANGKKFKVAGINDEIRNNYKKTHPIGTIITYKYNGHTNNNIPRFPRYLRIRN